MAMDQSVAPDAQSAPDDSAESASPAYTIEITCTADGKISVGVESADQENAEESGAAGSSGAPAVEAAEPTEPAGEAMPAKNIKDALVMALDIYKNNGEMTQADDSDEQFTAGYKGGM